MNIVVVICYLIGVAANIFALSGVRLGRLQFIDGIVVGMTYYITLPMAVILMYGHVGGGFSSIEDYRPYQDLTTTFIIISGTIMISALKIIMAKIFYKGDESRNLVHVGNSKFAHWGGSRRYQNLIVVACAIMQLFATMVVFVSSGMSAGKHWADAGADLQSSGFLFVILPIITNFARTALFGGLSAIAIWQPRLKWRCIGFGLYAVMLDMFFVLNRICVLYFLFMLLIIGRKRIPLLAPAMLGALMMVANLSTAWTYFRSYFSSYGYSVANFVDAINISLSTMVASSEFVDRMNGVFESINIAVLNSIVNHHDKLGVAFGAYIIRPATVLIPRSIWPSRPTTFPLLVGQKLVGAVPLNSTLFGEPFANSPIFWPMMLLMMIVLYDYLFRKLAVKNATWGTVGAFIGLAWWRFDASFPATCTIFSWAMAMALGIVVVRRRAAKPGLSTIKNVMTIPS